VRNTRGNRGTLTNFETMKTMGRPHEQRNCEAGEYDAPAPCSLSEHCDTRVSYQEHKDSKAQCS